MDVRQREYENIIFFLSLLNCIKIFLYGNKVAEIAIIIITVVFLLYLYLTSRIVGDTRVVLLLSCTVVSLFITAFVNGGWGAVLNYIILMLSSILFVSYGISRKKTKIIFMLNGVLLLLFLLCLNIRKNYSSFVFHTIMGVEINPNMVGMIALISFFSLLNYIRDIKYKFLKFIGILVVGGVCGLYIYISECRSVLLCLLVFLFLWFFKKRTFKQSTFRKMICASQIASLVFVAFYLYLYRQSFSSVEIDFFGKSFFSGRQIVWQSAFDVFLQHPVIGSGASVELESVKNTLTVSAHNTIMSILYIFGIVPTICYLLFLGKKYDNVTVYKPYRMNQFVVVSTLIITFLESFYMESYLGFLFMLFFIPEFAIKESTAVRYIEKNIHDT